MTTLAVAEPVAEQCTTSLELMFRAMCYAFKLACSDGRCASTHVKDGWMCVNVVPRIGLGVSVSLGFDERKEPTYHTVYIWNVYLYAEKSRTETLILKLRADSTVRFPIDEVIGIVTASSAFHVGSIRRAIDRVVDCEWRCATRVLRDFVAHEACYAPV